MNRLFLDPLVQEYDFALQGSVLGSMESFAYHVWRGVVSSTHGRRYTNHRLVRAIASINERHPLHHTHLERKR